MNGKILKKSIIVNTVCVKMMDSSELFFTVAENIKEELTKELWRNGPANISGKFPVKTWIHFEIAPERYVFIRTADIARIILSWDGTNAEGDDQFYHDNFNCEVKTSTHENGLKIDGWIPDVIIKLRGVEKPLDFCFDDDDLSGFDALVNELDTDEHLKSGFVILKDDDGEANYIPVQNISVYETLARIIFPKDIEEEEEVSTKK